MRFALAFLCAVPAWAGMIASSDGYALTMQITDGAMSATFNPGDLASVPNCSCASGAAISVIEAWDGTAIVNGAKYGEGGFTHISGSLPQIGAFVAGTKQTVWFPISWDYDVLLFSGGSTVEMKDSGSGMGWANLTILQDQGPAYYSGVNFDYSSAVPEPFSFGTVAFGLLFLATLKA